MPADVTYVTTVFVLYLMFWPESVMLLLTSSNRPAQHQDQTFHFSSSFLMVKKPLSGGPLLIPSMDLNT